LQRNQKWHNLFMQKIEQVYKIIGSFMSGAMFLSFFSLFQKNMLGLPYSLRASGFVVPVLFGGISGLAIYLGNARLHASRERMRDFINNVDLIVQIVDPKGRFLFVNKAWQKTLGYSKKEALRLNLFDLVHPDHLEGCKTLFDALFKKEKKSADTETLLLSKSGEPIYLKGSTNLQIQGGKGISTRSIFRNMAKEKDAEYLRKLTKNIFENTTEGVIATDKKGKVQFFNIAFTEITGYKEDVIGKNINEVFPSLTSNRELATQMPIELAQKGSWQGELWSRNKAGEAYFLRININAIYDSYGKLSHHAGIIADITKEKEKEKTLYQLAMHDNLTKLPNKEMFYEHVELTIKEAKEKRQTFALLFLDLDNFKEINDQYGHLAGDKFLRALSQRLRNTTRENDVIARFGGDEFVALLRDIKTPENAKKIAKNIASSVSTPFNIEGKPAHASASIGISLYPHNGSINSLLKAADEAMYNAKEAGKNRIRISLRTETQPIPADELPQSLRHP